MGAGWTRWYRTKPVPMEEPELPAHDWVKHLVTANIGDPVLQQRPTGVASVFAMTGRHYAALIADGWTLKGDHIEKEVPAVIEIPKYVRTIRDLKAP